jgi:hypothetical protein
MTTTATKTTTPFYFTVGTNQVAELRLRASSFSTELLAAMGAEKTKDANDIVVTVGREAAMQAGVFFLAIYYQVANGKTQRAIIPVAPSKADTAYNAVKDATYRSKKIVKVSVPRRRKFVV